MLMFFTGVALALTPQLSEDELAAQAPNAILGVVNQVDCFSSLESEDGVITNRFVATIDVEEVLIGSVSSQIQLVYTRYEYPADYPADNCQLMESHHPQGERARYYLQEEDNGMYPIFENGYFIVDASTADAPVCESINEADEQESETNDDEETNKASSCASLNHSDFIGLWLIGLGLIAFRKQKS